MGFEKGRKEGKGQGTYRPAEGQRERGKDEQGTIGRLVKGFRWGVRKEKKCTVKGQRKEKECVAEKERKEKGGQGGSNEKRNGNEREVGPKANKN